MLLLSLSVFSSEFGVILFDRGRQGVGKIGGGKGGRAFLVNKVSFAPVSWPKLETRKHRSNSSKDWAIESKTERAVRVLRRHNSSFDTIRSFYLHLCVRLLSS